MHHLTVDQIDLLVQILIEEFGTDLADDQIEEQAAMLLEDVAGFEMVSDDELSQTIDQIRSAYHVASHQ